jgi:hypothetical protein
VLLFGRLGFQGLGVAVTQRKILLQFLRLLKQGVGHGDIFLHHGPVGFKERGLVLLQKFFVFILRKPQRDPAFGTQEQ